MLLFIMACTPSIATAGKEGQKKSTPAPLIALAHCRAGSDDPEPKPKRVEVLKGNGGKVRGLEFHPTEPLLFSCGDDAQLICHDFDGVSKRTKAIREISRKKVGDKTVAIKFDASGRVWQPLESRDGETASVLGYVFSLMVLRNRLSLELQRNGSTRRVMFHPRALMWSWEVPKIFSELLPFCRKQIKKAI